MNAVISGGAQRVLIQPNKLEVCVGTPVVIAEIRQQEAGVSVEAPALAVQPAAQIVHDTGDVPVYHGLREVTPSQQEQVLETGGYLLTSNVIVKPIPKNYGLITWNGSYLTVS